VVPVMSGALVTFSGMMESPALWLLFF
jgi:hypothetical protein